MRVEESHIIFFKMEIISVLNTMYRKNNLTSFKSLLIFLSVTMFKLGNILDQMLVPDKHVLQRWKLFTERIWRSFTQGIPLISRRNKFTEMKTRNNWLGHHSLIECQRGVSSSLTLFPKMLAGASPQPPCSHLPFPPHSSGWWTSQDGPSQGPHPLPFSLTARSYFLSRFLWNHHKWSPSYIPK